MELLFQIENGLNKMLLVQEYLETHSFGDLAKEHGVYASFSKSGHKWSLNYDQIEAKEADPLAQECRGLVLACEDGHIVQGTVSPEGRTNRDDICPQKTKILAFPMKRFFNYGQGAAATIDWTDSEISVLEKLDGTLCIVYYDPFTAQWCVATRAVPEADLLMDNGIFTFRTLFEKALFDTCGKSFEDYVSKLNINITYCFELTTPYNRIVVNYKDNRVTLLSARRLDNHKEFYLEYMTHQDTSKLSFWNNLPYDLYGVPMVQVHKFTTVNDLIDWVSSLNPMEHEGVVVRDSNFNRVKVKNAAYVAYNRARDVLGTSERNCLELILQEKDDDVIPFLPEEIVKNLIKIKAGLHIVLQHYDDAYAAAKAEADMKLPNDKKTFALIIKKYDLMWSAPFFQMFDGKVSSMKDFIKNNRKDGTWSNGFLDKLLEIIKKC